MDSLINKLFVIYGDLTIRVEVGRVEFEPGSRTILTKYKAAETFARPTGTHKDDALVPLSHNQCVRKVTMFAGVLDFLSEGKSSYFQLSSGRDCSLSKASNAQYTSTKSHAPK
jgi:hypothetical protein